MNFGEESKVCSASTAIGEAEKSPPFPLLPVLGIFYVHTDVFIVHSFICAPQQCFAQQQHKLCSTLLQPEQGELW